MTAPVMDMGQMLGVLINLKELQERGRAREQQALQFAQSLGVEKAAQLMRFMDMVGQNPQGLKPAMAGIGRVLGLEPEQTQALEQYIETSPESSVQLRERLAREGFAAATPLQQGQMRQEAAFGATTGMSRGGAAESGVRSFLASDGDRETLDSMWTEGLRQSIQRGFVSQQANPLAGEMQQSAITSGMVPRAAGIQYGGDLTAAQQGSLELQGQGLVLDRMRLALDKAEAQRQAQANTGLDVGTLSALFNSMTSTVGQMTDENMPREARENARRRLNSLADFVGLPQLRMDSKKDAQANVSNWYKYAGQYFSQPIGTPAAQSPAPQMPGLPFPMPQAPVTQMPMVPPVVPDALRRP